MTATFYIGLRGRDISRFPLVPYAGTLAGAKRAATKEFGGGLSEHVIAIEDADGWTVAIRRMNKKRWEAA